MGIEPPVHPTAQRGDRPRGALVQTRDESTR